MAVVPKVNLNSVSELKNTTDDALAPYMKSQGFKQSHTLTDVRHALGFTACSIAGATFYYDWALGFEKTKIYTLYAVIAYFVLNSLLTLWMWMVEGNTVYVGSRNGVTVKLSSYSSKYSPIYELTAVTTETGKAPATTEAKNSFGGWFDQQGYLVPKPLQAFLQSSIPVLAKKTPEVLGSVKGAKKSGQK